MGEISERDKLYNAVLETVKKQGSGMDINLVHAVLAEVNSEIGMKEFEDHSQVKKIELAKEPLDNRFFTKDFANMIQLFNILTRNWNFSEPFRVEIDYDPKQLRTSVKTYLTKESLESYIQKVTGKGKD